MAGFPCIRVSGRRILAIRQGADAEEENDKESADRLDGVGEERKEVARGTAQLLLDAVVKLWGALDP